MLGHAESSTGPSKIIHSAAASTKVHQKTMNSKVASVMS